MQREEGRLREPAAEHRRRTRRAERHLTSQAIHTLEGDDLDTVVPVKSVHDVGRKTSPPPKARQAGAAGRVQGLEDLVLEAAQGRPPREGADRAAAPRGGVSPGGGPRGGGPEEVGPEEVGHDVGRLGAGASGTLGAPMDLTEPSWT